jgi:hypothetical protein
MGRRHARLCAALCLTALGCGGPSSQTSARTGSGDTAGAAAASSGHGRSHGSPVPSAASSQSPAAGLTLRGGGDAPKRTRLAGIAAGLETFEAPADRWLKVRGALKRLPTTSSPPFGHGMRVITSSMSGNGRYLFQWDWAAKKDDAGHDGQFVVRRPFRGSEERYEGLAARDRLARYYALTRKRELWLLDTESGKRERLGGRSVDLEDDNYSRSQDESQFPLSTFNRQVAFDAYGTALTYHLDAPERVVLRQLADGKETTFAVPAGWFVWRAEPGDSRGSVRAFLVRKRSAYRRAAPSRHIDPDDAGELCGTAIAERLAYPSLESVEFHSDASGRLQQRGTRARGTRRSYAWGTDLVLAYDGLRRGGTSVPIVAPCKDYYAPIFVDDKALGYSCGDRLWLHRPAQRRLIIHPRAGLGFERSTLSYSYRGAAGRHWAMVRHERRHGDSHFEKTAHFGRMRLDTGAIEYSPVAHVEHQARVHLFADPSFEWTPWRGGINRERFFVMNLADGALYDTPIPESLPARAKDLKKPQPGIVVAPRHLGYYTVPDFPTWVTTSGCILLSLAPKREATRGPWQLRCPKVALR